LVISASATSPPLPYSSWKRQKLSREQPMILQACDTWPSCLPRSNRPILARITLRSAVIGSAPQMGHREGMHPLPAAVVRTIQTDMSDQVLANTADGAQVGPLLDHA